MSFAYMSLFRSKHDELAASDRYIWHFKFFFAMQAVKLLSRCETYTDCPKTQDPASFIGGIEVWLKVQKQSLWLQVDTISGTPGYACPIYARTGQVTEFSEARWSMAAPRYGNW